MHAKLLPEIGGSPTGGSSTGEYREDCWVGGLTSDRSLPVTAAPGSLAESGAHGGPERRGGARPGARPRGTP
ncbi:hypothetical protein GCM10010442_56370 [Kitasatospora kifunensis]